MIFSKIFDEESKLIDFCKSLPKSPEYKEVNYIFRKNNNKRFLTHATYSNGTSDYIVHGDDIKAMLKNSLEEAQMFIEMDGYEYVGRA